MKIIMKSALIVAAVFTAQTTFAHVTAGAATALLIPAGEVNQTQTEGAKKAKNMAAIKHKGTDAKNLAAGAPAQSDIHIPPPPPPVKPPAPVPTGGNPHHGPVLMTKGSSTKKAAK